MNRIHNDRKRQANTTKIRPGDSSETVSGLKVDEMLFMIGQLFPVVITHCPSE